MTIANATVLRCPHCGGTKEVMAIMSGNTFGATQWSDTKWHADMLPQVSYVQRCPHCGKYFFNTEDVYFGESEDYSAEKGELTYEELKEALVQLQPNGENERVLRIMLLWAFNDLFGLADKKDIPVEEWDYFKANSDRLLKLITDKILMVEIYREQAEFEQAAALLKQVAEDVDHTDLLNRMRHCIEQQDRQVFTIYGYELRVPVTHEGMDV